MKTLIAATLSALVATATLASHVSSADAQVSSYTTPQTKQVNVISRSHVPGGTQVRYMLDNRTLFATFYDSAKLEITDGAHLLMRVTQDSRGGLVFANGAGLVRSEAELERNGDLFLAFDHTAVLSLHPGVINLLQGIVPSQAKKPKCPGGLWVQLGCAAVFTYITACVGVDDDGTLEEHCVSNLWQ